MADVGSVTNFNANLPNPLAQLGGIMSIANTAQQNQLLQTANQQRQLELHQGFANDLMNYIAPQINNPGMTQAQLKGIAADRARSIGALGQPAYDIVSKQIDDPNWRTNLKNIATSATGPQNIMSRTGVMNLGTGETSAVPSPAVIGQALPTGMPLTGPPSIGKMQADLNQVGNFSEDIAPLIQQRHYLSQLPVGSMGPGTEGRQHLEEGLFALSPTVAKWAGVNTDKIKDFGAFQKYSVQAANQVGGSGTDLQLMQNITGRPNPKINDLTDRELIDFNIAVARMGAAKTLEASKAGPNAQPGTNGMNYINKRASLSTSLDPRAFMFDMMTPDQKAQISGSLKTTDQKYKFNRSIDIARRNGLMDIPVPQQQMAPGQ